MLLLGAWSVPPPSVGLELAKQVVARGTTVDLELGTGVPPRVKASISSRVRSRAPGTFSKSQASLGAASQANQPLGRLVGPPLTYYRVGVVLIILALVLAISIAVPKVCISFEPRTPRIYHSTN